MKRTLTSVLAANIEEPDQKSAMERSNARYKEGGVTFPRSYARR